MILGYTKQKSNFRHISNICLKFLNILKYLYNSDYNFCLGIFFLNYLIHFNKTYYSFALDRFYKYKKLKNINFK